jgi:hypothetical protein
VLIGAGRGLESFDLISPDPIILLHSYDEEIAAELSFHARLAGRRGVEWKSNIRQFPYFIR